MSDPRPDESDDRMFTDSFAPSPDPLTDPVETSAEPSAEPDDELEKIEDLLPEGEPTDGPAPLP